MSKFAPFLASLSLIVALAAPTLVSADTSSWWCSPQFSSWFGFAGQCGTGTTGQGGLAVYVSVSNSYNTNYTPSQFTVSVSGQNPSPATFPGSVSGTPVLLNPGPYSVSLVLNSYASQVSYSTGCSGTLAGGQNALCVITVGTGTAYSGVIPYVCPQNAYGVCATQPLTCTAQFTNTSSGVLADLTAFGGSGSVYNWQILSRSYLGTGPHISVLLQPVETQSITVTSGTQVAVCNAGGAAVPTAPTAYPVSATYPVTVAQPTLPGSPTVTTTYVPSLPNTGFAPVDAASYAFALVLLVAAGVVAYKPLKHAIAAAIR